MAWVEVPPIIPAGMHIIDSVLIAAGAFCIAVPMPGWYDDAFGGSLIAAGRMIHTTEMTMKAYNTAAKHRNNYEQKAATAGQPVFYSGMFGIEYYG